MPSVRDAPLSLSARSRSTSISSDPFAKALRPPSDEAPAERNARVRREREAKRVSDEIDQELRRERAAWKKKRPVRVLLLGQSESGKSTTLKNFQMHHAPQAWCEERACWRAVIQLNLIRSVEHVLDTLTLSLSSTSSSDDIEPNHPLQPVPLSSRYTPLFARLTVAERILQRLLSPSDAENPGDYRSFGVPSDTGSLMPPSPTGTMMPPSPTATLVPPSPTGTIFYPSKWRQEFFVRSSGATGAWKSRFLRGRSDSTSTPSNSTSRVRSSMESTREDATDIMVECRDEISRMWSDPEVRAVLAKSSRGRTVEDMPGFFLNDVDRIATRGYEPSDDDVIRARLRTMGVQEHRFTVEGPIDSGREWRIYDVGGARSQRTSWLSFFDEMDAIIFLAPINCFDEMLAEDRNVNRLEDSLLLWRTICRSPLLAKVQLVLFLNKVDLLRRKIASGAQVARHVTSFDNRSNDYETVCKYFKQNFKEILKQYSPEPRPYYAYFTSVTNTNTTGVTLRIVREGILRSYLYGADIL